MQSSNHLPLLRPARNRLRAVLAEKLLGYTADQAWKSHAGRPDLTQFLERPLDRFGGRGCERVLDNVHVRARETLHDKAA